MAMTSAHEARAVDGLRLIGPTGGNKVMAGELSRLARRASLARELGKPSNVGPGALLFSYVPEVAVLAARYHRTSARVLRDLYTSTASRLEPLYAGLLERVAEDGRGWFADGDGISVVARSMQAFAAGERQVVGTVKNALIDGAARRGVSLRLEPEAPDLLIDVRLYGDTVVVALDLAGRPMNQRGYRTAAGAAPLRENLAAMLVMLARHDARREPLVDPMAGTGTIGVEAACLAQGRPVFLPPRKPACERHPQLRELCERPAEPLFGDTRPRVLVNEQDPGVFERCQQQVARAGVDDLVECRQGDFRDLDPGALRAMCPGEGGLLLCNPPYGVRLDGDDLDALYDDLGRLCRELRGWRAGFLVANPDFDGAFGRGARARARIKKPLSNATLKAQFLLYEL